MAAPDGTTSATLPLYFSAQFSKKFINNKRYLKKSLSKTEENSCRKCLEHKARFNLI